jgi:hypothetical protein
MKKEIFIHFAFLVSLFIFISLFRGYLTLSYWPLWVGGLVGTILPDVDHFIYIFFLRPYEYTSQRASYMLGKKDVLGTLRFLAETRYERTKIIFHTATFQIIFVVLAFWVITSSGSMFGRGLVLAFLLHMLTDQIVDIMETGGLSMWFKDFPLEIDQEKVKTYWVIQVLLFLILAFIL